MISKIELDKLMKEVDKTKKPKHWKKFINKHVVSHNIFLKYGKRAYCTHCGKYSDSSSNMVNHKIKECEFCGNTYYMANNNIKNFRKLKDIGFYVKVGERIVLRIFEIESTYDYETRKFKHHLQEYARFIPDIGLVINNSVSFAMWNMKIYHNLTKFNWHVYTGQRKIYNLPIYPYNKKHLFKGTVYEYAPIKEFKEEYKYYDDFTIYQIAGYKSFELLWKMGLKRLSLDAKYFNKKGSFVKRFGVPKSFLKFMVENNIDYDEYKILKLIQKDDIKLIRFYNRFNYNYLTFMKKQGLLENKEIVEEYSRNEGSIRYICKYMTLKKFLNYKKGVRNLHIYVDYLKTLEDLGYRMKCKDELFPKQLIARHDKLIKKLKITKDMNSQFAIYQRYLELSQYTFEDEKYIIFPAPSIEEMQEEGRQQGNCVGYRYVDSYKNKETEIYFIRHKDNMEKSLITLEYKNNRIAQRELKGHAINFSKEQLEFMSKWEQYRNFMVEKEKYQSKVINYQLKKLAA